MITNLGTLGIADAIPGADALAIAGTTGIELALPALQLRINSLQGFNPQPFSFNVALDLALKTVQSLQLAISLNLPVPDLTAQINAIIALLNSLLASLDIVNQQLQIIANYQAAFSGGSIEAYTFDGALNNAGGEFSTEFTGRPEHANALMLVATEPTAWASLSTILKTS